MPPVPRSWDKIVRAQRHRPRPLRSGVGGATGGVYAWTRQRPSQSGAASAPLTIGAYTLPPNLSSSDRRVGMRRKNRYSQSSRCQTFGQCGWTGNGAHLNITLGIPSPPLAEVKGTSRNGLPKRSLTSHGMSRHPDILIAASPSSPRREGTGNRMCTRRWGDEERWGALRPHHQSSGPVQRLDSSPQKNFGSSMDDL